MHSHILFIYLFFWLTWYTYVLYVWCILLVIIILINPSIVFIHNYSSSKRKKLIFLQWLYWNLKSFYLFEFLNRNIFLFQHFWFLFNAHIIKIMIVTKVSSMIMIQLKCKSFKCSTDTFIFIDLIITTHWFHSFFFHVNCQCVIVWHFCYNYNLWSWMILRIIILIIIINGINSNSIILLTYVCL